MIARRHILRLGVAAAGGGLLAGRAAAADDTVRLVCGFGVGNPTDLCVQLIGEGFSAALGQPVTLDYEIGEAGKLAALHVIDATPDGRTLLVAEILNLALHDAAGANLLPRLQPIARITRGFSTALVTLENSELENWQGFVAAARARRLTAVSTGRQSTVGMPLVMIEQRLQLVFDQQETASTTAAVDLLLRRRADVAAIDTRLALVHNSRQARKLRVLATFGARPSPDLPKVPTFAALIGDPKAAYTIRYGLFAPDLIDADTAAQLTAALASLKDDEDMHYQARQARIPAQIDGPATVLQTIARDRRLIAELIK